MRKNNIKKLILISVVVVIFSGGIGYFFFLNSANSLTLDGRINTTVSISNLSNVTFPRLAGYNIGSPQNYHEKGYQKQLAKRDLIILGLYYGWSEKGKTPAYIVNEIKTLNPNILIGAYTVMTEITDKGTSDEVYRDKLYSEIGPNGLDDWWARNKKGKRTDWAAGAWGGHDVNLTSFVKPDTNGDRWAQWLAKKDYELLFKGVDFDFWFFDNNFWKPRSNPDWNRDGINDDQNDLTVQGWLRAGQRAHYKQAAKTAPNLYLIANVDFSTVYPLRLTNFLF